MAVDHNSSSEDVAISETEDYILGSHLYVRAPSLDLNKELSRNLENNGFPLRFLHYYCDVLTCPDDGLTLRLQLPPVHAIFIFARDFLSTTSKLAEIQFAMTGDSTIEEQRIYIYCGTAPSRLEVRRLYGLAAVALFHDRQSCPDASSPSALVSHEHIAVVEPQAVTGDAIHNLLAAPMIDHAGVVKLADEGIKINSLPRLTGMAAGRRICLSRKTGLRAELIENVPVQELESSTPATLQVFGRDFARTKNLPKLLQYQFLKVSQQLLRSRTDPANSIARLKYILLCTRASVTCATLTADAQKLLDRLELSMRIPSLRSKSIGQFYAPQLTLADLLDSTNIALSRAKIVDKHVMGIDTESNVTDNFGQKFATLLAQIGNNMRGFIDSDANYEKAKAALTDLEAKRRDMERHIQSTAQALKRFEKGMKKYKDAKESAAWWSVLGSVLELGVSIGLAVATCGAGAPLTLANLGKAQQAVSEGVKLLDQVKLALERIIKIAATIGPKVYAASRSAEHLNSKLYRLDQDIVKTPGEARSVAGEGLKEMAAKFASSSMAYDSTIMIDYLGILADWNEFDNEVDVMFRELARAIGQDSIDGMSEYQVALKNQAVRGRTVITAMRNSQEAQQFYYRQDAERLARATRQRELLDLAKEAREPSARQIVQRTLRWTMLDELANIKRNLFVRCHQVLLGLIYLSNRPQLVANILEVCPIDSLSSLGQFETLLLEVRDRYDEAKLVRQTLIVDISTTAYPQVFQPDWRQRLALDRVIYFAIPDQGIRETAGMHQVRISKMNVIFEGMKSDTTLVQWDWELGPYFIDRSASGDQVQYYMPTQRLRQIAGRGDWLDNGIHLPRPSVFCNGRIVFKTGTDSGYDPEFSRPDVDLSQVTDVRLRLECQASLV